MYDEKTREHLEAEIRELISNARHHNAIGQLGFANHTMELVDRIRKILADKQVAGGSVVPLGIVKK